MMRTMYLATIIVGTALVADSRAGDYVEGAVPARTVFRRAQRAQPVRVASAADAARPSADQPGAMVSGTVVSGGTVISRGVVSSPGVVTAPGYLNSIGVGNPARRSPPFFGPGACNQCDYGATHGWGFPGGRWDPSLPRD